MLKLFSLLALFVLLSACKNPPTTGNYIPVVGLDSAGNSKLNYVPTGAFQRQMSPFIGQMSHAVAYTLDQHENTEGMPWYLSRVTIGLALEAKVDLFEIAEAEVEGDIELRFQKAN